MRRVEKYGVFIELARSNVVGLAHISEVASGVIRDLAKRYQQGQVVRARILAIDRQAGKVSLGLKPEYVESGVEEEQEGDGLEGGHGMKDLDEEMVDVLDHDHDDVDDEDEDDEVGQLSVCYGQSATKYIVLLHSCPCYLLGTMTSTACGS